MTSKYLLTILFAAACSGQPKPEPAPVIADTVSGRATISIERPQVTQPSLYGSPERPSANKSGLPTVVYESVWDATANLDLDAARQLAQDPDEKEFVAALSLMLEGKLELSEHAYDSLWHHTRTPFVAQASRILLTATLQYQEKWSALAGLAPDTLATVDPAQKSADVEAWAKVFARLPKRSLAIGPREESVPLTISRASTPMLPVRINGKEFIFWFDTGASMSIISSDVAKQAGLSALSPDTLAIATAAGKVPAVPTTIDLLEVGQVRIEHAPGMIIDAALMHVSDSLSAASRQPVTIDGMLGWDTIRELDVTLDFSSGSATIRRPEKHSRRNSSDLFWAGVPLVQMRGSLGRSVHFALDTGAEESFATEWLLEKAFVPVVSVQRHKVGGVGEDQSYIAQVIPQISFDLEKRKMVFKRLLIFAPAFWTFVHLDGVLGADVAKAGVMRIDASNGIFSISNN